MVKKNLAAKLDLRNISTRVGDYFCATLLVLTATAVDTLLPKITYRDVLKYVLPGYSIDVQAQNDGDLH